MIEGRSPGISPERAPISAEATREELNRVLSSHEFRSSKRSQDFLRYVVENTLSGHADVLKERTIGIDVFGRPADYEPSDDATVRVKAGEVRKRLGLYYSDQGSHDPIRIELPLGTYVPEFHDGPAVSGPVPSALEPVPAPAAAGAPPAEPAAPKHRPLVTPLRLAGALLLLAAAGAIAWMETRHESTLMEQFWAPVLDGSSPVVVCAAFVPVWNLDPVPPPGQPVRVENFVPLTDQFVGMGDLIATSRLTSMLTRLRRTYRLKVGNDVSFDDLRTGHAILVGYSYTRWKELSSQMRYFIDAARRPLAILDNGAPTKWALPNLPRDRRTNEDYAIVSRVSHPDTHAMLVEIAGITQYGTDAAGDLVTNPELMTEALRGAPAGWQTKSMQLVLHVKVIAGAPSSPQIVARYYW